MSGNLVLPCRMMSSQSQTVTILWKFHEEAHFSNLQSQTILSLNSKAPFFWYELLPENAIYVFHHTKNDLKRLDWNLFHLVVHKPLNNSVEISSDPFGPLDWYIKICLEMMKFWILAKIWMNYLVIKVCCLYQH